MSTLRIIQTKFRDEEVSNSLTKRTPLKMTVAEDEDVLEVIINSLSLHVEGNHTGRTFDFEAMRSEKNSITNFKGIFNFDEESYYGTIREI